MTRITTLLTTLFISVLCYGQTSKDTFGKGFRIVGKDSSFTMRIGIRFQTLFTNSWDVRDDDFGNIGNHSSNFLLRRSRLKFDGFAYTPKLKYKVELGLTNRDIGGAISEVNSAARVILDAYLDWNFYQNFSLKVGQFKLPGNRERVVSSANLQFVDRSLVNARYNIDRDVGLIVKHHFKIGKQFIINEAFAFTQGEGRNITVGNLGGYNYTFRVEALPFGKFKSKGDYVGSAIKFEDKPKLSIGLTYDINDRAVRQRGNMGRFMKDANGNYFGRTLYTFFADLMFKYKNLSVMAEYANKNTGDGNPIAIDPINGDNLRPLIIGSGLVVQAGWMFENNVELAARYTNIIPRGNFTFNETEYTLGLSKFFVGHKLKVQGDISYVDNAVVNNTTANKGENNGLTWRMQVDIHF